MGSRSNSRRSRGTKRGLASFVSFVVLFALALGQGSSLVAIAGGTSRDTNLPSAQPAAEAPSTDQLSGDTDGGAASASRTAPKASQLKAASAGRAGALAAPGGPGFDGGDIGLDFVAAGPFTYNHDTGVGGNYANRTISKTTGVVESLEGGDFECGDLVVFFTQVVVDAGATATGSIDIDYAFGAETTGQPGIGFDDIVSVGVNTGDSGNVGLEGTETATLIAEGTGSIGGSDAVTGTVRVTGLDASEHLIVRLVVHLGCDVGASPTGNIQSAIQGARVVQPEADTISVGNQTIPFKKVEDVAQPGMNVTKTCPAFSQVGDTITYSISIQNTGNETLNITSVVDTVNGHAPVNITASFPATVAAGATVTRTYQYTVVAADPDPLPNSVTVTAQGAISKVNLTGSSSCETDILNPKIDVSKTCTATAQVGDTITYTITVKNTGDETLNNVTVNDTLLGNLSGSFDDVFSPNEEESHDFTYTVTAQSPDPVPNTVTASGTGATSQDTVTDTASCSTDILNPKIDVSKTCTATAQVGDTITYTITVKNTGDETLNNVTVNDTLLGNLSGSFDDVFSPNEEESHDFTYTVTAQSPDPVPNTVTASGTGATSQDTVTDTASCSTDILNPKIDVSKTCTATAQVGDTITYTITVKNTGDETLNNVTVNDTLLGNLSGSFDDVFSPNEEESHDFTYTVTAQSPDPVPNTVTASGTGVTSEDTVTDTAECSTDVLNPDITVTKSCTETAQVGDTITYTITVTNSGDEDLEGITVEDTLLGDLSDSFADTLDVEESESHDFTYLVTAQSPDPVPNSVTASGTGVTSEDTVTDTAECSTDVLNPDITVTKSCTETAQVGDTITYTITVTNSGDEDLEGITVEDTLLGDLSDSFADTLDVEESESHDFTYLVTAQSPDPVPNSVTASGTGVTSEDTVTDTAECSTDVLNPDITVTKSCTETAQVGDTITYTITVTNSGDEDLEGITVEDTLLGDLSDSFADTLDVEESESHDFTYLVTAQSPDPVPNSVTASGTGVTSEDTVTDTAECSTDVLFPAINIVKDGPELVHRGDTITYTFVVTNPGEVELFDVELTDPICDEGTIDPGEEVDSSLAVGEVWTSPARTWSPPTTRIRCRIRPPSSATRRKARAATRSRTATTTWWTSSTRPSRS